MEWKKSKSLKLKNKQGKCKLGLNNTMNAIPTQKIMEKTSHHKILTQGGQTIPFYQTYSTSLCHKFKENLKGKDEDCSTFANSLHSFHPQLKLSKDFAQIGRQMQHENDRMKAFLTHLSKNCIRKPSITASTSPKMSLLSKIKYQTILINSMHSLKPCR